MAPAPASSPAPVMAPPQRGWRVAVALLVVVLLALLFLTAYWVSRSRSLEKEIDDLKCAMEATPTAPAPASISAPASAQAAPVLLALPTTGEAAPEQHRTVDEDDFEPLDTRTFLAAMQNDDYEPIVRDGEAARYAPEGRDPSVAADDARIVNFSRQYGTWN